VFGVRRSFSALEIANVIVDGEPVTGSIFTTNIDASVLGVTAVGGISVGLGSAVRAGIRVQSPVFRLRGTADFYTSQVITGDPDEVTEIEEEGLAFHVAAPWDLAVGLSYHPARRIELALDGGLQLADEYEPITTDPFDTTVAIRLAPRVSLGADFALTERVHLLGGLTYNRSAATRPEAEGDARENYVGATAGVIWQGERTRTGIGAFFLRGEGEFAPYGEPGAIADTRTRLIGALLTTAYRL
jgi:hypothetical protein